MICISFNEYDTDNVSIWNYNGHNICDPVNMNVFAIIINWDMLLHNTFFVTHLATLAHIYCKVWAR